MGTAVVGSTSVMAENSVSTEENAETAAIADITAAKNPYSGWYIGAGINHQYTQGDVYLDDNLAQVTAAQADAHSYNLASSHAGRVGGTLNFGYGYVFANRGFVGGDFSLDITGNRKHSQNTLYHTTMLETRGIVPTIAINIGGILPQIEILAYARFGFTFTRNEFSSNVFKNTNVKTQWFTPIIGVGLEKAIANGFSVKIDADYRFASDRKANDCMLYDANDGQPVHANYRGSINNRMRGYAVRVVAVYHF